MRLQLLAIPMLAAAAFASSPAETTTYVDGNLTGVTPNSGGTLNLSDEKQMVLRTGLTNVSVPYETISHAELGAVKETPHNVPFYKVWGHGKKTQTQLLIVNFKNAEGEDKTMTLELAQPAAASVMSTIQSHTKPEQVASAEPAPEKPADPAPAKAETKSDKPKKPESKPDFMKAGKESTTQWWGDDWWKTTRNADKWAKPAGTNAPDQQ